MNAVAFMHAWKFTHFSQKQISRTEDATKLSPKGKLITLVFGVDNPRPVNRKFPAKDYQVVKIKSNKEIECWSIPNPDSKGTVIICHGYSGDKSTMLDKADVFYELGYSCFLVDFMGSGGSEGSQTTIGYDEAEQVRSAFEYVQSREQKNIFLFGTSMGSVAIMKALHDSIFMPSGVILECPFGSMYKTVCARFKMMNAPAFPMAGLLVFWGGVQNGFWAFEHNPISYAKAIQCPVLLLYGGQDPKVSRAETDAIYNNLAGKKELIIYPDAGHENLLRHDPVKWTGNVNGFLLAFSTRD